MMNTVKPAGGTKSDGPAADGFFANALVMGFLVSITFGLLSFFVVLRKMSFLGTGIAHTAFGGVALGVLLGFNPFVTSLFFCAVTSLLIGKLVRYGRISYDSSIGIFFSLSMAMGAIFLSLKDDYNFDLMGYLFGNILGINPLDNIVAGITLLLFLPFLGIYFQRILFMTFDEEVAVVSGIRTDILDTMLLLFLAGIIVVSIKIVGIILVSAFVVLPASFGMLIFNDYRRVIAAGIVYTLISMTAGLFLSYFLDTPAGATIVVWAALLYFISLVVKRTAGRN